MKKIADAAGENSDPRADAKAEYKRLAKEIGHKFVVLTEKAIARIRTAEGGERTAALEIGRTIAQLEEDVRGAAKRAPDRGSIYRALAGHPACRLEESQLRNYSRFAKLHAALSADGRQAPDVSMSHYIAVSFLGDIEQQRKHLKEAAEKNLSVSQMLKRLKGEPMSFPYCWYDFLNLMVNGAITSSSQMFDALEEENLVLEEDDQVTIREMIEHLQDVLSASSRRKGGR